MNDAKLKELDTQCNALFRKLDELKAAGRDGDPEYMQALYTLKDLTDRRLGLRGIEVKGMK